MIMKFLHRLARLAWLLPGFILWAAFPPMAERFDCLFALAPLLWLSRRGRAKESFRRWYLTGLIFWCATLSWMPAIIKNGGPWYLVVLGWFCLAAYCALFFGVFGFFTARYWSWAKTDGRYWKRLVGLLLVEPTLWCGLELMRARFFGGFSWNQLGIVPANSGFGAPAAWGGVYLLSAVVILINGTIASIAERVLAPVLDKFAPQTVPNWVRSVETLLPFLLIWGAYSLPACGRISLKCAEGEQAREQKRVLTVGLVQRNFPCCFKENGEDPYAVYGRLLAALAPLKPDLIVLPESALAEFGPIDRPGVLHFARFVHGKTGASLLAGGTRYGDGKEIFNSAVLYPAKELAQRDALPASQTYDKVHLVPFGEYIPGDKEFPFLQNFAPVGSCTEGVEKFLVLDGIPLGVSICYEDTDSAQVGDFARAGARALVFITNDSWFSGSIETEQHAWQARARAIETGLPVVRVGNSGVTGIVSPDGSAEWLNGPDGRPLVDAAGTMLSRVDVSPRPQTFYVRFGDKPLAVIFLLLKVLLVLVEYLDKHEKRRIVSV